MKKRKSNKQKIISALIGLGIVAKLFFSSLSKRKKVKKDAKIYILGSSYEGLNIAYLLIEKHKVKASDIVLFQEEYYNSEQYIYCPIGDLCLKSRKYFKQEELCNDINLLDANNIKRYREFSIDKAHKALIYKLSATSRESVENLSVEDWFLTAPDFFDSDFWEVFSSIKFFKKTSSLLAFKEEASKYLLQEYYLEECSDLDNRNFSKKRNEIIDYLKGKGVEIVYDATLVDLGFTEEYPKSINRLDLERHNFYDEIKISPQDLIIVTNASILDNITTGNMENPPEIDMSNPESKHIWDKVLAVDKSLGNPEKFLTDIENTSLHSFVFSTDEKTYGKICKDLKGRLIIKNSAWDLTLHFIGENKGIYHLAGYGMEATSKGNRVDKTLRVAKGREILEEVLAHLNVELADLEISKIEVTTARIPYATANRYVKNTEDLPPIVPEKFTNLVFVSNFVRNKGSLQETLQKSIYS